jgi:hypothetical protein
MEFEDSLPSSQYHPPIDVGLKKYSRQVIVCTVHDKELTGAPRCIKSRDSSVGVALGYGFDDRGSRVRFPAEAGNFSLHHRVQNGSGAHPASYPMGARGSFPGVKRPGREADHSPPTSAEVKNVLSYTSTPPIRLHGLVLS